MDNQSEKSFFSNILDLYREAVRKLPVLRYSWGIIVIICILALMTYLKIGTPEALWKGSLYVIGIMFLIFIFSLIAKTNDKAIKYPLYILVYSILLTLTVLVLGFAVHNFTSYKFDIYYTLFGYPDVNQSVTDKKEKERSLDSLPELNAKEENNLNSAQNADISTLREDGKPYRNNTQEAQFLLKALGYNIRYPDGFEGPMTTNALEDFQKKHNLPISGVADNQTLTLLRDRAKKSFLRKDIKQTE